MKKPESPTDRPYSVGQVVDGNRWDGRSWVPVGEDEGPGGHARTQERVSLPGSDSDTPGGRRRRSFPVWAVPLLVVGGAALLGVVKPGLLPRHPSGIGAGPPRIGATTPPVPIPPRSTHPVPPAVASDDARSAFAAKYGSFDPISVSGTSRDLISLPDDARSGLVTVAYDGTTSFRLRGLDDGGRLAMAPTVGSIADWHGTSIYGAGRIGPQASTLRVEAKEPWTLKINPIYTAPELTFPASGSGSAVYLYRGGDAEWAVTHKGSSNFVITAYYPQERQGLLANTIGNYEATVRAPDGAAIVSIEADGDWSIAQP